MDLRGRWLGVGLTLLCGGCAAGDDAQSMGNGNAGRRQNPLALATVNAPQEAVVAMEEPGPPMETAGMEAPPPMGDPNYMGESCRPGSTFICECPEGGNGIKRCEEDMASPTGGTHTVCLNCAGTSDMGAAGEPTAPVDPNAPPCMNGARDGMETDIDCGGLCDPCMNGSTCVRGIDCASLNCSGGTCADQEVSEPMSSSPASNCDGGCNNSCSVAGPFPCCNQGSGQCGCSWVPGAYCT